MILIYVLFSFFWTFAFSISIRCSQGSSRYSFVDVSHVSYLEEELQSRQAGAADVRKKQEELAAQFKTSKEAQEFGGAVLAAQWRAAAREVAKRGD